jgi:ubiquinone/menaquinone biosynthesis C-methylase UbiE
MERGYQHDYSATCDSMHSLEDRRRKANTMVLVLRECLGGSLAGARVLNLGCSTGIIDEFIAPSVGTMVGADIDAAGIELAQSRRTAPNLRFEIGDAMDLRFEDAEFDVVICSQVYEHVPDATRLMSQIGRVLAPGGLCYFAATNRWAVMEKHHHLPFLSWLPQALADRYMRAAGKGSSYYEKHLGYFRLRTLVDAFDVEDFTGRILGDPERYGAGYMIGRGFRRAVARAFYAVARPLFPGYIWILRKRSA